MSSTILIVDDSESIRAVLRMTLQFKGYKILEADDGKKAYELLRQTECDLLITDIVMPHMSGTELVKKVREELGNEALPIIICTAEKKVDEQELLDKGANRVLMKPVSPRELLEVVESLL